MIRVLVAEDHTIVREGIKQLIGLAKDLLVVGEASNGEQLLETLRQVPCEVVLLDISMPGVNGLEAIPRIRALNNPPAILVLSMHDEAQMAARALKIGAAGYATKDSDPALLLTAIRKVAAGGSIRPPCCWVRGVWMRRLPLSSAPAPPKTENPIAHPGMSWTRSMRIACKRWASLMI